MPHCKVSLTQALLLSPDLPVSLLQTMELQIWRICDTIEVHRHANGEIPGFTGYLW